jgi:hypothetical protein
MRAFLVGCLAAVAIAYAAYFVLNSGYTRDSASSVFTTTGTRL